MKKEKKQRGITLVALVITIIIIIILATVTINMAFGDNGLIRQAELARDLTVNQTEYESEATANLVAYMNEILEGSGEIAGPDDPGTEPDEPDPDAPYVDEALPIAPSVADGMIPVKYDESLGWVRTEEKDPEWYNYSNVDKAGGAKAKHWANVVLSEATWKEVNSEEGTNRVQVLDEEKPYSMLVWIPRYAYQITNQYHQTGTGGGTIDIVFVDTNNQNKEKTKTYNIEYPEYATGTGMTDYVVHPAFSYGDDNGTKTELAGIWVGKFETSNQNCTTTASTGQYDGKERAIMIKGNVTSWRSISANNIFSVCTEMNDSTANIYGLSSRDEIVDPHMMKNTEWGAVAYLAQNATYGKGSEITMNSNSSYLTGGGNYKSNLGQSTNGNITGVYDMSGGSWEYVAAYAEHENSNESELVSAASRYKDVYSSYDYATAALPSSHFGDAVYETSSSGTGSTSWYSGYSIFPTSSSPFFIRGGALQDSTLTGIYSFVETKEGEGVSRGFRLVVPVLSE